MFSLSRSSLGRFVNRAADASKEHFFAADALLASRSLQPHVVVLCGVSGVSKRDSLFRLAKQGYGIVSPPNVVADMAANLSAGRDAALEHALRRRDEAWHTAVDAALASVAASSRSNVLFVSEHPAVARFVHAPDAALPALRAALAAERQRWNVSFVLLYTDPEIRRQRLESRAFQAPNDAERTVRLDWLREADAARAAGIAGRYDELVQAGDVFDGTVDATSVKQCVARLLSMLSVGRASFDSLTRAAAPDADRSSS
jgi:hypothetical protein